MTSLFFRNPRLAALTVLLILVAGLAAYTLLPRIEDPILTERFALVTTRLPGASAERVESLVTEPLEEELDEIEAAWCCTAAPFPCTTSCSTTHSLARRACIQGFELLRVSVFSYFSGKKTHPIAWRDRSQAVATASSLFVPFLADAAGSLREQCSPKTPRPHFLFLSPQLMVLDAKLRLLSAISDLKRLASTGYPAVGRIPGTCVCQ